MQVARAGERAFSGSSAGPAARVVARPCTQRRLAVACRASAGAADSASTTATSRRSALGAVLGVPSLLALQAALGPAPAHADAVDLLRGVLRPDVGTTTAVVALMDAKSTLKEIQAGLWQPSHA